MKTNIIQRRYPDQNWDFKAVTTNVFDNGTERQIVFYTLLQKDKQSEGLEMYTGANYIVGSNEKSRSRHYGTLDKKPKKYQSILEELKRVHNNTEWSSAEYVNNH